MDAGAEALYGQRRGQPAGAAQEAAEDTSAEQRRADALGLVAESALAAGLDPGSRGDRYQDRRPSAPGGAGSAGGGTRAVTALAARLASQGVDVDAGATLPDWWGGPVDYGWEIDWLRSSDRRYPEAAAG